MSRFPRPGRTPRPRPVPTAGPTPSPTPSPIGNTFTLTTNIDTIPGLIGSNGTASTAGDDAVKAQLFLPTSSSGAVTTGSTLNPGDNLDLGAGVNKIDITVVGGASSVTGTATSFIATNLQNYNISNFSVGGAVTDIAFVAPQTGIQNINLALSTAANTTKFSGISSLVGASMASGNGSLTLGYNASVVAGTADVQNLLLNNVTGGTFLAEGIETLNIASSGQANGAFAEGAVFTLASANSLNTVNVSGSAPLVIKVDDTAVKTFNASTATGSINADVVALATGTSSTNLASIQGGSANDEFFVGTQLDNEIVINGNGGTNTLALSGGLTAANAVGVSNIQAVKAVDTGTDASYDLDAVGSVTTFVAANTPALGSSPASSTVTATNFTDTDNLVVTNGEVGTVSSSVFQSNVTVLSAVDTSSNVLNAAIAGVTFGDLTANDAETVRLASNANPTSSTTTNNIAGTASFTDATSVVVTGATALTIKNLNLVESSAGSVTSFNSTGATGAQTVTFGTGGIQSVTTGSANDSVTFKAETLDSFDAINLGGGTNTLTAKIKGALSILNIQNAQNVTFQQASSPGDTSYFLGSDTALTTLDQELAASSNKVEASGLANGATVKLRVTGSTATNSGANTFTYASGATTGSLNLSEADTYGNIGIFGVTTLNLSSISGATLSALTSNAQLQTLNITGAGNVNLGSSSSTTGLATINASQATGAVTVGAGVTRTTTASITGGSGADNIGLNVNTQSLNTINAGTGTDTLTLAGTSNAAVTVVDLSSTTDQLVSINGQINSAVQRGFENLDASALTSGFGVNVTAASTTTSIKASQNADVITGASSGTTSYVAGAGNDAATLAGAADGYNFAETLVSGSVGTIAAVTASVGTDTISGYTVADDSFVLDNTVFGSVTTAGSPATLTSASFATVAGTAAAINFATSSFAGIVYDSTGTDVYFVRAGSGLTSTTTLTDLLTGSSPAAVKIADLVSPVGTIAATEFLVVS